MYACRNGHKEIVELLMERNIKLNAKEDFGRTAFVYACTFGHKNVVQLLLDCPDKKIELNIQDKFGWTAFMHTCMHKQEDVVNLLLEHSQEKGIIIPKNIDKVPENMRDLIELYLDQK